MFHSQFRFSHLVALCLLFVRPEASLAGPSAEEITMAIVANTKPGASAVLPAGVITISGIELPPGVSLRGAGYDKTTLIITGQAGIHAKNSQHITLSDLTVQGASRVGVELDDCTDCTVSRVRVLGCLTGIFISGGANIRVENCAAGSSRTGIAVNRAAKSTVVNCSMVGNSALGLSLSGTTGCAAFNNLMVSNAIGVYLALSNTNLVLDHNLYWGKLIGKGKDIAMPTLFSWKDMEDQDGHSVSIPVSFQDEAAGNYKPTSMLTWAPSQPTTAYWGVEKLGDVTAPELDINGEPRGRAVGAWGPGPGLASPAPDGMFTVESPDGYKSAGLFDAQNREVAWLFNLLPLPQGRYPYALPTRGWQGRPIPPGQYTLKISEANLSLKYINSVGNTGSAAAPEAYASTGVSQVVYDSKDRPVLCLHWTESARQFRAMDPMLQHERWMIPGSSDTFGVASDGHGHLYSLRDNDKETYILSEIDEDTGKFFESAPGDYGWVLKKADLGDVRGIAILGDHIYLASIGLGKIFIGDIHHPTFDRTIDLPGALSPAADAAHNLIWVISGRTKVAALDPDGAVKTTFDPGVPGLLSVAVNNGRMVLLSTVTGKLYLYDLTDPTAPKLVRTIGKGDGPYGPIEMDRLMSQNADANAMPGDAQVGLDREGVIALTDIFGVKLFGWDGKPRRDFEGIWGQYMDRGVSSRPGQVEMIDLVSMRTLELDEKTGSWDWGTHYRIPALEGFKLDTNTGYFFIRGGVRFGVHKGARAFIRNDGSTVYSPSFLIARYPADGLGVPVLMLGQTADGKLARFDSFDQPFSREAAWKPILNDQGKSLSPFMNDALIPQSNGDLMDGNTSVTLLSLKGLDNNGVPDYDYNHIKQIQLTGDGENFIMSPYDFKTKLPFPGGSRHAEMFSDGSIVCLSQGGKTAPNSSGFSNWAGNYAAGYDPTGHVRWLQPFPLIKDPEGAKVLDDLSYTMSAGTSEVQILDKDGMYLGEAGVPNQLYWNGMWLDNTHQYTLLKGSGDQHYIVYGNFNDCTAWWMEVQGRDTIRRHQSPVTLGEPRSTELAALPAPIPYQLPTSAAAHVKVVKLDAPMPMDGDLKKWRTVIPTPQVIVTPETGIGINGPGDCSALIRLAHEGGNLYVQVLRFDDVVTMHQPLAKFFKQDGLEMSINSYVTGIKINVTHTRDAGDVVYRDGWFLKGKLLTPEKAPRKIYVLDNAADVPERKLIESIYGVDLSDAKVIVTEFKLPLDDDTFEGRLDQKPLSASGGTFYLGFLIDDNDSPGADLQKTEQWPATFGTFSDKSTSALATLE